MVCDVPVLHRGYVNLFERYQKDACALYLLGEKMRAEGTFYHEEIRALPPVTMKTCIESLQIFDSVEILDAEPPGWLQEFRIITTSDALSQRIVEKYFPKSDVVKDTAFLRWDEKNVAAQRDLRYAHISCEKGDREMIVMAKGVAQESSDYWRHIGGVAVLPGGKIIGTGFNCHVPSEHLPYVFGDPRDHIKAGVNPEIATVLHAEQWIITQAARQVLGGASLYLTMFPCAMCAKEVAYSGIKRLYFETGHVNLNGEDVLRSQGVEIVQVLPHEVGDVMIGR